jgi:hypothetical protein
MFIPKGTATKQLQTWAYKILTRPLLVYKAVKIIIESSVFPICQIIWNDPV